MRKEDEPYYWYNKVQDPIYFIDSLILNTIVAFTVFLMVFVASYLAQTLYWTAFYYTGLLVVPYWDKILEWLGIDLG